MKKILLLLIIFGAIRSMAAITGPHAVCVGDSVILSDTSLGTTAPWSSSFSYAAIDATTGVVLGVTAGVTTISYALSGGGYDTYTFTVNPLPPAITGRLSLCVGETTSLGDATPGGTWSSSGPPIASIVSPSGVVTAASSGTTVITYTLPTGCKTTATVTVNPAPDTFVITGGGSYCPGDSCPHIRLSGSQIGIIYQVYCSATSIGSAVAGTGFAIDFGAFCTPCVYTVVATNPLTSCTSVMTGTVTVTINPLPPLFVVTGGGSYCPGSPCPHIGLSGSTAGINYQLYCNNSIVGGPVAGTGAPIDIGAHCDTCTYKIVAGNAATGCKDTMLGSVVVTVAHVCAITGRTGICIGDTSQLTGCSGCTWSSSNMSIATVGPCTGVVTGISAGTTDITYTSSSGCISIITVTVSAVPMLTSPLTIPTICSGDSIHYVPTSNIPGTTFSWARPFVMGISPLTSFGAGNIDERLTNTSTTSLLVTYIITLSNHGCTSTQNVTVLDSLCNGPKDPCSLVSAVMVKDTNGCCYSIYISNKYESNFFSGLVIETGHLNIDNVTQGGTWGGINYQSSQVISFGDTTFGNDIPLDSAGTNGFLLAKICVSGVGPDIIRFKWLGPPMIGIFPLKYDTVCVKEIDIVGCGVPVDTNCAGIINQKTVCNNGVVTMQFQMVNKSNFIMSGLTFYTTDPNVKPINNFFPIDSLSPGDTSQVYSVPLVVLNNATSGCFYFSACDLHTRPGGSTFPSHCCLDSIKYCFSIPQCDRCDAISITSVKTDPKNCCYKLNLTNHYYGGQIKCLRFLGMAGSQFATLSGWSIEYVSAGEVKVCAPGGGVDTGVSNGFVNFCITGNAVPPYLIAIEFLGDSGQVICRKELSFDSCTLVTPTCATITDDSMYCDGKTTKFSFYVKNYSPFTLYQFDLRLSDTMFKLDKYFIDPVPPIPVNGVGGPYIITVDSPLMAMGNFCVYLTGHNNVYIADSVAATECCTDSMDVACVPVMSCANGSMCCQFAGLTVPNGITPNNDGYDDKFVIGNSAICTNIDIKVYNRWGNVVYKQAHYNNTWAGTNTHGDRLPQDTYYVVIKLATGAEKAFYIDIRY